jgi:hypothetical protein
MTARKPASRPANERLRLNCTATSSYTRSLFAEAASMTIEINCEDFEDDLDYPAMMSGAHRKPATEVGAPAITQHIGIWIPYQIQNRKGMDRKYRNVSLRLL